MFFFPWRCTDELPVWGMVGEYMIADSQAGGGKEQGFVYTHREFSISYNGNQIIEVNLTSEKPEPIIRCHTHITHTNSHNSH